MSYRAGDYLAVLPHNPIGLVMRALKRFDQQRIARFKVRIKAAVRKASLLHHLSYTDTCVAVSADRTRGDINDALVRFFLAAIGGAAHGGVRAVGWLA